MVDTGFHQNKGPFSLAHIAQHVEGLGFPQEHANDKISSVAPLDKGKANCISFLDNTQYVPAFEKSKAGYCIVNPKYADKAPENMVLIFSDSPYYSYAKVAQLFFPAPHDEIIHRSAVIDDSATIGNNCYIGPHVTIGKNVTIGDNCCIHSGCVITHTMIGNNVILHPNSSIGQDGFGFAFHLGAHHKVPQLGKVIISDDVELGASCTIDRGTSSDTFIGKGTKIDNLVQIGHNTRIGAHCILVAQSGVAGSVSMGDYCVVGGQVAIAGHLSIGSRVQIAGQSGVMKDIPDGHTVGGYPAVPIKQFHRQTIALKNLVSKK